MAEEENTEGEVEKVTSIDDDDVNLVSISTGKAVAENSNKGKSKNPLSLKFIVENKKNIIILASSAVFLIAIVIIAIVMLTGDKKAKGVSMANNILDKLKPPPKPERKSKLRDMLKEAKRLYEEGKIKQAIDLYSKAGKYEEFLTFHNLGVADMKAKKYKEALENFEKSIQSNENKCVSAINAAVASLHLNDKELFKHYISLARNYLPTVSRDPLYDYYYSLIMYYEDKYIEALSVIRNKDINYYKQEQYKMSSTMLSALNDDFSSIKYLEKQNKKDNLALGLTYSKVGEYDSAIPYLKKAKKQNDKTASMALYMSYVKAGNIQNASQELERIVENYGNHASDDFPIKVFLKESLFDVNIAQENFKKKFTYPDKLFYKLFIYFAPYKIYNEYQVINYIRKGSKSFYIDDITFSKNALNKGNKLSRLNVQIAKGIKLAIDYKIRGANQIFKDLERDFKFNSMLFYNLALTYAQLGYFGEAAEFFNKSYSLDRNNKVAALLTVMSKRLANLDDGTEVLRRLAERLNQKNVLTKEDLFYESVVKYLRGILDDKYISTPYTNDRSVLNTFYKLVLSSVSGSKNSEEKFAKKLKNLLGDNVVSNILYFYTQNKEVTRKDLAQNAISFMKTNQVFLDTLYYGPIVAKELYVDMANISGMGYSLRDILKERLILEKDEVRGIMHSLAFLDIYLNFFEEAFSIYNTLIDDFGEDDPNTLFLAAVSAMGAKQHANAIALLELAVLNKTLINTESRYVLALLYQESFNLKSASSNMKVIKNNNFTSEYFDFNLRSN